MNIALIIAGGSGNRMGQDIPKQFINVYDKPVLIVHADTDEAVPVRYAYEAAEKYANCTLKIIEGDTHCYDHHLDQVVVNVKSFLKSKR